MTSRADPSLRPDVLSTCVPLTQTRPALGVVEGAILPSPWQSRGIGVALPVSGTQPSSGYQLAHTRTFQIEQ